ncbi:U3 small nucleolar RNA-associated protein [Citrus sinensis]|uniref:U3 small nucleolar RNA-associated protein n=1 Tax=Citrus sinensis TaxID=2711 RepID=A0ACB8LLH3_CITSI|nr:U3 small nucleolar RNA-associated protein [Citrus sinensis]
MSSKFDRNKRLRKIQEENGAHSSSPSSSEEASGEESSGDAVEEIIYKEPSVYDNLLMKLGSSSESVADAFKIRQRQEEGRSDSEEEGVGGPEPLSESEQEDDISGEGTDSESRNCTTEGTLQQPGSIGIREQNEDADSVASDTDEEHGLGLNGQPSSEASAHASSFHEHFGYNLSKEEVDDLSKKKLKYEWEVPAVDMSNCKWVGTGECFLKDDNLYSDYGLKPKLYKHWLDIYNKSGGNDFHSSKQRSFFSLCNSYRDILHSNKKPFYLKGQEEDSNIMETYLMHSLNHIFRTRDLVTKNDTKVAKNKGSAKEGILIGDAFLDRGFTRPKVLILLPLKSIALNVVKRLIRLTPDAHKVNVEHIDRFCDEFGTKKEEEDKDDDDASQNIRGTRKSNSQKSKPSDYQILFGGNNDDNFSIGIKFTRKSIKLYNDFYTSDMIVASPINLHQNWSWLIEVVEQLNRIPSKQHGTDVMRIRQWYLDGYSRFYRQTVLLSYHPNPEINAFFNHHCANYQGKVKLACEYKGVLPKVLLNVRQIYERFNADSIAKADDARLEYFTKKIRGIQNLIIYSLPERKEFYPEIVNMLEGSHNMTCTVLFSRFDMLRVMDLFPS